MQEWGITMIFDTMDNLILYKGIYHNLDMAIDYLSANNISIMETGRHDIMGDAIYMNVMETKLQEEAESCFEVHYQYIDLHIDINGKEKIEFAECSDMSIIKEYDEKADYALANGRTNASCDLDQKHFVICIPGEPHMPCLKLNDDVSIRKAVLKIRINE